MAASSYSLLLFPVLYFLIYFHIILFHASAISAMPRPLCHADESSALLQFKESLIIDKHASNDPLAYPKLQSWKLHPQNYDCCSWDGVTCDMLTGHVIGLDLSSSCLYGSINSTSSLFRLLHLLNLNLADNHFNYSLIASEFSHFLGLTSLNLSSSFFSGPIPPSISKLPNLCRLDLSMNDQLFLKNIDFGTLFQNFTSLEYLWLDFVDLSSTVPNSFANFSFLKFISLGLCNLYGEFPTGVFQIPHLQTLIIAGNWNLKGHLPEFNFSSSLEFLSLGGTSFSGGLPDSIGNLGFLKTLGIAYTGISGQVPSSLGNMTQLVVLILMANNFEEQASSSLSWLGKLNRLRALSLSSIIFDDGSSAYFSNLTQLSTLCLEHNTINGRIPSWLGNMTQLVKLSLDHNQLQGPITDSIFQLENLECISVAHNNLCGRVELAKFLNLKKLSVLRLSANNLSLVYSVNSNASVHKFTVLSLGSCNLSHFPYFLSYQDKLEELELSNNFMQGPIPRWVWNKSRDTLKIVDLSNNFLTGFGQQTNLFSLTKVIYMDLSGNIFQGSLPTPPSSTQVYILARNKLTGEISPNICRLKALYGLDLSHNNFSGKLPQCLGNFSNSMQYLNLARNNFQGMIPQTYTKECNIRMLFLDSNKLQGRLPRSLANCKQLEFLVLGNNQINDTFPSWLGQLQLLKVLILRSNQFHGVVGNQATYSDFSNLQIIDLSHNYFSGQLPMPYFLSWKKMKMGGTDQLNYVVEHIYIYMESADADVLKDYSYSMAITNKGILLNYSKILECFVAIDFSSNKFDGEIPNIIGNLSGLRLLNLSNNNLSGGIPSSLGNLTKLEALDLSQNSLLGVIPQQLTQLIFLESFNASNNHLTGPIPQGKQFNTFENNSYERNPGLCGDPLSRKCGTSQAFSPSHSVAEGDQESDSWFDFGWRPVLIGYGFGLIIGLVIGHVVTRRNYKWFLKIFGVRKSRWRKGQRGRVANTSHELNF